MGTTNLQRVREAQGLSQRKLARVSGVSRQTIMRLEAGAMPQLRTARRLALALKCPTAVVFPDERPEKVLDPAGGRGRAGAADGDGRRGPA